MTQVARDKFKEVKETTKTGTLTFWKVYRAVKCWTQQEQRDFISGKNPTRPERKWQLFPAWYYSRYGSNVSPGEIISDRKSKDLTHIEETWSIIEKGIHVYLDYFTANTERGALQRSNLFETTSSTDPSMDDSIFIVVPVIGNEEDFIAAGNNDAVLMKVHLSQEDYDKTIKELEEIAKELEEKQCV